MADIDIRAGLSDEERVRLEKIDRIDSNKKRKKVIMVCVTAVLILFFLSGTLFGAIHLLNYEGTETLPEEITEYPPLPVGEKEILESLNLLINDTKMYNGVKLDISFSVTVDDESIVLSGNKADISKVYLDYVKDSAMGILSDCYSGERHDGVYGEDFSDFLFDTDFSEDDADISVSVPEENENDLKYTVSFPVETDGEIKDSIVYGIFSMDSSESVKETLSDRFSGMVKKGEVKIEYSDFTVTANVNRLQNKLTGLEQKRVCSVTLPLTFVGDYADFGELTLSFDLELKKNYSFTRVEFFFRDDVFYIEKGASDEFKTKVISDQSPADIEIELVSSDPSVLSIDGSFYKGEKTSAEPVTVTGKYTYNGITYEDTCLFYVRVPVESVKLSEKELTLSVGESKITEAVISPADATLTDVYWFTTDENIVKVDENGNITALSNGSASVYCITLDGNYKSSCSVEVK